MEFMGQVHASEMGTGSASHSASFSTGNGNAADAAGAQTGSEPRYHECLRNHAAAQDWHAVDGCGEFMPPGDDGAHALRCAACGCHRSFHRKDDGQRHYQHHHRFPLRPAPATPRVPLLMPPPLPYAASHPHAPSPFPYHHQQQHHQHTPSGGTTTESSSEERGPGPPSTSAHGQGRKRFRTRFTAEQKEQMLELAERVGWRMQRQDEALVEHFCALAGVRRQVFKVWMHNNKHHHRRQTQEQQQHSEQPQQQQ